MIKQRIFTDKCLEKSETNWGFIKIQKKKQNWRTRLKSWKRPAWCAPLKVSGFCERFGQTSARSVSAVSSRHQELDCCYKTRENIGNTPLYNQQTVDKHLRIKRNHICKTLQVRTVPSPVGFTRRVLMDSAVSDKSKKSKVELVVGPRAVFRVSPLNEQKHVDFWVTASETKPHDGSKNGQE